MMVTVKSLCRVRIKVEADFPDTLGGPARETHIEDVFVANCEPSEAVTLALETIGPSIVYLKRLGRPTEAECQGTVVAKTLYALLHVGEMPAGSTLVVPNTITVAAASIPLPIVIPDV